MSGSEEHAPRRREERAEFAEEAESLWRITLAPTVWAVHFVICYSWVSVACERLGGFTGNLALLGLSAVALVLIGWIGWRAFRQWDVRRTGEFSNPEGKAEHRHEFLGHAAFLLAIISGIGVVYVSLPLVLLEGCR